MTEPIPTTDSRRPARQGLYGGLVSSRQRKPADPTSKGPKKPLKPRVILDDALELVRARKGRLLLGLFLMAINRVSGLVLPGTTKYLLDDVIGKGNRALLMPIVLAAGAATLLQAVTSFSLSQVLGKAAQRSITEMRRQVQQHVSRLSVSYFEQTKTGALLSRVMNDAEGIRNLVGTGLVEVVGGLVTAVLALGILLYLNVKLTLIALGVLSLFSFIMRYAFRTLRPLFRERSKINAEISGRLTESFSGMRVVKAYQAEQREALVFTKGAHRLYRNIARTMTGFSAIGAASTLLLGVIGVAIMLVGAQDVLAHRMTVGDFFAFTLYLGMLVGPMVQIVNIGSQLTEAFAGLERIREIRNEVTEDEGEAARKPLLRVEGRIELRDVWFEYQPDTPVLKGVSLVAAPGTSTALVGPSGSGKSTLIGLVAAFHRPTSGRILVDGHDLSEVRLNDYRSHLGVVFQDNFLFDGTVLENIAYANPHASDEEVLRAARIAHCDDFVARLPEGYSTIVGERGVKLSGGERQRVAIARAILADPRILILDEATSSLDSESEALIQEGLTELMKGRTTFVIAHRLSTIRRADTILVLEGGEIIERGKHEELLRLGGRYHDLYTRQYNLESNLFRNPGEAVQAVEDEEKAAPQVSADAAVGAPGRLPLMPV
ncbi:MAG TPA: ABC transporter ATP-binding protein [Thermoanaerobaculia bacterium]|jgi:subfamily B ATP-binding cassette protein MsbA|nr:ABC transporter ATP-binding protein [Thermoanaerobaculia bacterium]